jgi:DNA-binding response OmpR family regulator
MPRILVIEDDPAMQAGLRDNLELEGLDVTTAGDGQSGLDQLLSNAFDLAILDVMLPKMSGFDVLKKARERGIGIPVIMLTARGEEVDRVLGLELGADDYVTKPFSLRELLARVKAVLRRAERVQSGEGSAGPITIGTLRINFSTYNAFKGEQAIEMTPKEFEVLRFLWAHRGSTVSRDALLKEVWGYNESITSRTVDNFILKLRQKLEENTSHPRHIFTIHGIGYKLVP